MISLIILGMFVGLPVLLLFALRSNAAIVFLAVCSGSMLLKYMGNNASFVLGSALPHSGALTQEALSIGLLLLPALLTMIFLRRSMSGAKAFLNLLPAIFTGALIGLSAVPLLSPMISDRIMATSYWTTLTRYQDLIVGAGVFVSLTLLWLSHKKLDKQVHNK